MTEKKAYQIVCILSGMIACVFYLSKIQNIGAAQLKDLINFLFSGSLLPTGVLFIACAFCEKFSQVVLENKIGLVASGITIVYIALENLGMLP